ncbi:MAG: Hsp20/alpha crystallin family protein [Candidatus Lokiarchaeota archaeon]|nr:Hsp20/alpha crystallin family protein [Candidatus Lokiarchaeota archaeon]
MDEKKIKIKKDSSNSQEDTKEKKEFFIRRANPFSLFQNMDQLFDNLHRNFFNEWFYPFNRNISPTLQLQLHNNLPIFRTPLANIIEDDKNFNLTAELPGLDKEDIEISLIDGNLEIKGEIKEIKNQEDKGDIVRKEYRSAKYYRCFSLPNEIDEENVDATLEKGILKIIIPKKEIPKKEKKIINIK